LNLKFPRAGIEINNVEFSYLSGRGFFEVSDKSDIAASGDLASVSQPWLLYHKASKWWTHC
jgi:hypothetical protein